MALKRMIITDSTYCCPPGFALGTSAHISSDLPAHFRDEASPAQRGEPASLRPHSLRLVEPSLNSVLTPKPMLFSFDWLTSLHVLANLN